MDRIGLKGGNKGHEAALSAVEMANLMNLFKRMELIFFHERKTSKISLNNSIILKINPSMILIRRKNAKNLIPLNLSTEDIATLTFDFRGWGESSGTFRFVENPKTKTEDIIEAVNFSET